MFGLLKKFREGLAKTQQFLAAKTAALFGGRKLDAASVDQLEEALYEADFGPETTAEILDAVRVAWRKDSALRGQDIARIGASVLERILTPAERALDLGGPRPHVICLLGVNGSGKTTTAAKLAHRLQAEGRSVLLGACDTFRAAAVEQLKVWAERTGTEIVAAHTGADSAAVAFDAWKAAQARGREVLILDTAGRLHTKAHLMDELAKLRRVLQKHDPTAPHTTLLVVDGSHGTNALEQARVFHQSFPLGGLVVTKLDGTSRGGALAAIHRELKLPVYFIGLGEAVDDLQPFSAGNYARGIFGDES